MDSGNNSDLGKGKQPRHTSQQIQRLEAFFTVCPHPDEKERRRLSRDLGLEPKQVKFWFQNKRNQAKLQNDRADNNALRLDNERMRYEIQAFTEILKNVKCPACDAYSPFGVEARKSTIEELRLENSFLKEAHEGLSNEISSRTGRPISHFLALSPDSFAHLLNSSAMSFLSQESASSSHTADIVFPDDQNSTAVNKSIEMSKKDKEGIVLNAFQAINELAELLFVNDHLWVISPTHGGYVLHYENYSKFYPKSSHLKMRNSRIESSKDSAVLPITASDLVELFLDMDKWADLFPTIVMEAKMIETLDTGSVGGSLHLMYNRMHILSPLVAPREFFLFRYCRQLDPGSWLIVDASFDSLREIHELSPTCCWRFPSGIVIQSLSNGRSKVTWVDHVEFNESLNHPLYKDLLYGAHGFGARRWLSTLQRMTERSLYSVIPASSSFHKFEGEMNVIEGRANIMNLTHRLIKDFCAVLSMPSKLNLSESTNREVRISLRNNNELGQPTGVIVAASTSVWLPLTFENLFNFLRDADRRPEWDEMFGRSPVNVMAQMPTGTHPGNSVSIMEPVLLKESYMWLLQENCIDPLGAHVVFAPIDAHILMGAVNGENTSTIPVLPCGFTISSDGWTNGKGSAGASTSTVIPGKPCGSLLTLAFQVPGRSNEESLESHMDAVTTLNSLLNSIIQDLKVALGCPDLG